MNKEIHKDKCVWVRNEKGFYDTECGTEGVSYTIDFFRTHIVCPYCGKPIHILEDR